MIQRLLVLGGTGFVGRTLCELLAERGGGAGRITVPTRRLEHARRLRTLPTVEVVQADVHDPAALAALVRGHDAAINLVAILHGDEAAFERTHVALPQALAAACRTAGVRRLLHVSAIGATVDAPSRYLRSKGRGEAALLASGLDVTLLQPSVIFGAEDRLLNLFARLQAVLPVMALAEPMAKLQPVWVGDVAAALVACLDRDDTIGRVYECAGPRVMTLAELVRAAGRWSGHARPVWPLPGPLASLQALLFECLPGEPLMSRDNLASLRVPNVTSGRRPTLAALGIVPKALDAVAPGYLAPGAGRGRLDALRRHAGR